MSVPVSIERLRDAMADFHAAPYFLTVSDDGRPHAVAVVASWVDDELAFPVGRRSATNTAARPLASLVWPPEEVGGYSLIVDGTRGGGCHWARGAGSAPADEGRAAPGPGCRTGRRLWRPLSACTSDCIPLAQPS